MTIPISSATAVSPTIRHATRDDLAAIERLLEDTGLPTAGVADIVNERPGDFFVATATMEGDPLVAVAGLEVCGGDALLRSVAVHPDWRSHGLGRELVRRIVCHAEEHGIRALYLLTMTAEHYFPRHGFERIERAAVSPEIAGTLEFTSSCPATAVAMRRGLARPSA